MSTKNYSTYTDEELIDFLRESDSLAFAEMYRRYYKDIYHYLMVLIKLPDVAEDLTHEIFLKIWDVRKKINITNNFKGYLFRVCHNKAVDENKKVAANLNLRDQLLYHYKASEMPEDTTAGQLVQYDKLVEEALNSISPQRRKVFEMCKKHNKSYAEVADELNISINTVKVHISKTLSLLRDFILQKGDLFLVLCIFCEHFKFLQ